LGKRVVLMAFVVTTSKESAGEEDQNNRIREPLPRLAPLIYLPLTLLFASLFGHSFFYITALRNDFQSAGKHIEFLALQ